MRYGFFFCFCLLLFPITFRAYGIVDTTQFGRPGLSDDTELQAALTFCSDKSETCIIPGGKRYVITTDLFIWGGASLIGGGVGSEIVFKPNDASRALLQVGLSPQKMQYHATTPYIPKPVFTGKIKSLTFTVSSDVTRVALTQLNKSTLDPLPRRIFRPYKLIFLWRTDGAEISHNHVDVAHSKYGFTGSGNDANFVPAGTTNPGAWVGAANQLVRKNIRITHNQVSSLDYQWTERGGDSDGNEGIALTLFNGAYIAYNTIGGFGDDVVAFHYGNNALIEQNYGESVDGRLYVSGSTCVAALYNHLARRPTTLYKKTGPVEFPNGWGASLIKFDGESQSPPPTQSIIYGNSLFIPAGLREDAMYFASMRAAKISNNMLMQPKDANLYGPLTDADLAVKTGLRLSLFNHMNTAYDKVPECFKGAHLALPNGLSFLPIFGDNYHMSIAQYMPVKNVTIENNNLAPDGNQLFTATDIAMQEHPSVAARNNRSPSQDLLGYIAQDALTCNKAKIVGKTNCHVVAVVDNRVGFLPWQTCSQNQFSVGQNLSGTGIPSNCTDLPDRNLANTLSKEKKYHMERIYYEGNQTVADKTLNRSDFAALVPGVVQAEYFHDASAMSVPLPLAKLCRNPFGKNMPAQPTQDLLGGCELMLPEGAWVDYSLNVLEGGNYRLIIRAKTERNTGEVAVSIDEGPLRKLSIVERSMADAVVKNLKLSKGGHKLRLSNMTTGVHINYFKFEIVR
ncbi:MAG TPA: hypothetical protein PK129_00835 [Cellvibrionaceae bacterium]|nr:hypothetical protein [Cellvibrionaceae bacterium]